MRGGDGRVGVPCGVDSGVVRDSGRDMGMSARSGWGSNAPTSGWLERPGGGCHGERRPAAACCPGGVRGAAPAAGRAPQIATSDGTARGGVDARGSARGTAQSPPASWRTPPTARPRPLWRICSRARGARAPRLLGRWTQPARRSSRVRRQGPVKGRRSSRSRMCRQSATELRAGGSLFLRVFRWPQSRVRWCQPGVVGPYSLCLQGM